ncbi:MAG: hypothetical protein U0X39_01670 [Bacteroidales bacterium]
MKTRFLALITIAALFTGCDLLEKASTVKFDTNLEADVPVVVTVPTKSTEASIPFTKTQDLNLGENADIEPYLSKIKEIDLNSVVVTITGLNAGQTITTLSLDVTGVGNVFTQNNITMAANSFTPTISATLLDQVAAKLVSDKKITLVLSGSVSGALTVSVNLNFDTTVTASVLK